MFLLSGLGILFSSILLLWGTALYAREVVALEPGKAVNLKFSAICIAIVFVALLILVLVI